MRHPSTPSGLVGGGIRVGRHCKTDLGVRGVEDAVEALEETLTVDKVKTLSGRRAEIVDDRVNRAASTADVGVERSWPNLAVGCQRVCDLEASLCKGMVRSIEYERILTEPMLKLRFWRAAY